MSVYSTVMVLMSRSSGPPVVQCLLFIYHICQTTCMQPETNQKRRYSNHWK